MRRIKGRTETPRCRYREFAMMRTLDGGPSLRTQSPYMSETEAVRAEMREDKKRWLTRGGFHNFCGKADSYRMLEGWVVGKDPAKPVVCHEFRTIDRSKWVANNFKY